VRQDQRTQLGEHVIGPGQRTILSNLPLNSEWREHLRIELAKGVERVGGVPRVSGMNSGLPFRAYSVAISAKFIR